MPAPESLKRAAPEKLIFADIVTHIRTGELRPGDQIMPINRLWKAYGVGRNAVIDALKQLVERGVLTSRRGSGYYVAEHPLNTLDEDITRLPQKDIETSTSGTPWLLRQHLAPRGGKRQMHIYISDVYEKTLALWRKTLTKYERSHPGVSIRMSSCCDGHVQDFWDRSPPDLILTVPKVLTHIGTEHFLPFDDLAPANWKWDEMIEPVEMLKSEKATLPGLPFSSTIEQIFINRDLAPEASSVQAGDNFCARLFTKLLIAGERHNLTSSLTLSSLYPMLVSECATSLDSRGKPVFDRLRTKQFLHNLQPNRILLDQAMPEKRFLDNSIPAMLQCCFAGVYLRSQASFTWNCLPLHLAGQGIQPISSMLLAVPRTTENLDSCRELIEIFASHEFQESYGTVSGIIPARRTAALAQTTLHALSMTQSAMKKTLSVCRFNLDQEFFSEAPHLLEAALNDFLSGKIKPAEVLRLI